MSLSVPYFINGVKVHSSRKHLQRDCRAFTVISMSKEASNYIPAAPIFLPEGPWQQIPGGVTAAKGFKAAGMYGGLRALGEKPDLALVTCDVDAISAGAFTTNVVAAAPVLYCKRALNASKTARAVLINAGQANAATGDAGYQDVIECSSALAKLLQLKQDEVLIESTGVIGRRIKKEALLNSLPHLVRQLSPTVEGANSAAVAITTTDLVSKSVAVETELRGTRIRVGGMAKGSGMIHPNMATMLGVVTTDASVTSDVWRKMVQVAVSRSFNQITVDGDTSTNDAVIALASGLAESYEISSLNSSEAEHLQNCLDAPARSFVIGFAIMGCTPIDFKQEHLCGLAKLVTMVMQGLAKSIAWDGEGATCLIEDNHVSGDGKKGGPIIHRVSNARPLPSGILQLLKKGDNHVFSFDKISKMWLPSASNLLMSIYTQVRVDGADSEAEAAKIARSVASSSLVKAAVYGRDPNWGRIACAAGYAGIPFNADKLRISLGDIVLMEAGQPLPFDRVSASNYLRKAGEVHGTVEIQISTGDGPGSGLAWGCDLSYDYVKINAEYTT